MIGTEIISFRCSRTSSRRVDGYGTRRHTGTSQTIHERDGTKDGHLCRILSHLASSYS
jgi:hypothetical protein